MIPAVALCRPARTVGADIVLLALGQRFDALAAQIDHTIEHGLDIAWATLEEFGRIDAAIVATSATTMDGLYVKARAACWALLGDFDSANQSASGARMAFSMMRDLIRLHAPHLENPGALQRLVKEIEEGAKKPPKRIDS
jgi:hypothetical protein